MGEAEVEGDKMVQKARFLSFSIVKHMGSHENMPTHCVTVYYTTRVNPAAAGWSRVANTKPCPNSLGQGSTG